MKYSVSAQFHSGALTLTRDTMEASSEQDAIARFKAGSGFDDDFWARADWIVARPLDVQPPHERSTE